jgi:hypothetical protein
MHALIAEPVAMAARRLNSTRTRRIAPTLAPLAVSLAVAASGCAGHRQRTAPAPPVSAQIPIALFAAADVPARGADEPEATPRNWPDPATLPPPPVHPGAGIAQHPMLYAGEGHNTMFLIDGGKVIWTFDTGKGGEIDDVWLMSNGHILFARMHYAAEVTPQKKIVWRYDPPEHTEVHSVQPIGLDKVLLVQNGLPPRAMIIDKKTGAVDMTHDLPALSTTDQKTVHAQFRRIRMTAQGTYLLPFLKMNRVVEYDRDWKEIWSYDISTPWAATRLHNGNTLITDEKERLVREVSPRGETVWEFKQADLPAHILLHNLQTAERLASGNTVIFSATGGVKKEERPTAIQALEVTPDKKLVWVLQDWKNLGPATTAQFLDQSGLPEKPGDLQK